MFKKYYEKYKLQFIKKLFDEIDRNDDLVYKIYENLGKIIDRDPGEFNRKLREKLSETESTTPSFLVSELYRYFYENNFYRFNEVSFQRLDREQINREHQESLARFRGKTIYTLTDVSNPNPEWNVIDEAKLVKIEKESSYVLLAFNNDAKACRIIDTLRSLELKYISPFQVLPAARFIHMNEEAFATLLEENANNRRLQFCPFDFENIFQAIDATKDLEGDYVEIGTFQGSSARATLNYLKKTGIKRRTYFLDTYEGFTYDEAYTSEDAHWQDTHTDTSIESVAKYLSDYPEAKLIKGNIITDGLPPEISKISVCNIDVDIYDAVLAALHKVKDLLVPGGIAIVEDFGHTPLLIGGQKAAREFLAENQGLFTPVYLSSGQLFLIKR